MSRGGKSEFEMPYNKHERNVYGWIFFLFYVLFFIESSETFIKINDFLQKKVENTCFSSYQFSTSSVINIKPCSHHFERTS